MGEALVKVLDFGIGAAAKLASGEVSVRPCANPTKDSLGLSFGYRGEAVAAGRAALPQLLVCAHEAAGLPHL